MKYIKIKVSFKFYPDRFYRVLLVPENIELYDLAYAIGTSVHVDWDHAYQFIANKTCYLPDEMLDGFLCDGESMDGKTIDVLGEKAVFEYDFGDDWKFDVRIYKRRVERPEVKSALILEGKGAGIWEDSISTFYDYMDGEIDDSILNMSLESDDFPMLPWYIADEPDRKLSDFDKPLDLEAEQRYLDDKL